MPFTDETLIPWLQEMTAYLRAHDANRHLVTNSYAIRDLSPIRHLPEMEIIQKHEYPRQVGSPDKDLGERAPADFTRLARSAPAKPVLLGEFGYGTEGYGTDVDRTGIHLHNAIWATTFAGYAGSGMHWFWDVYMEAYNAWHHFRGLNRFLEDIDLSQYQPFSPLEISGPGAARRPRLYLAAQRCLHRPDNRGRVGGGRFAACLQLPSPVDPGPVDYATSHAGWGVHRPLV